MRTAADRAGALVVLAVIPTAVVLFGGGGSGWLAAAVVVPVLAGLAASAAAARLGLPDRLETRLLAAGLAVLILLALLPAGLDGRSALGALGDGAAQLVTGTLPLVAGGPQLGIAVVSFSVATVVSVEVARKDGLLLPLVSPLLLYAAVLLVTAGGPPGPRYGALLVAAGSGLTIVLRHQRIWWQTGPADPGPRMLGSRSGRRPLMGPTLVGLVLVGVVGLVAWAGAGPTALPGSAARQPYDLRTAVSPGPVPLDNVSLLARFASIHDGPVEPSFSATVLGPPPGSLYWRLATFDQFQGYSWTSSALYRSAGRTLPPSSPPGVASQAVRASVRLARPSNDLPVVGTPVSVSVPGLAVSPPDNLLVAPAGMRPLSGYSFRSVLANPNEGQLLSARIPARQFDPASAPPSATVTSLAARLAAQARPDPFSRLAAIAAYLTGPSFTLQPPGHSPIGSGTYQVDQLLSVTRSGSPEQYAAAFALLARAMGFPSRLVVGYTGGHPGSGGTITYTTRDLSVWPEVELAGIGWVPFPADPAVTRAASPAPLPAPASGPLGAALREQQQVNSSASSHASAGPAASPVAARRPGPDWAARLVTIAAGILVAACGAGGALLLAKARRRRRQRESGDARERMRGSWEFVVDRVAEAGVEVPPSLTRDQTVDRVGDTLGASCRAPVAILAPLVDAAVYDRRRPPGSDQVDVAWQHADALQAELRRILAPGRRVRAAISMAPWRGRIGRIGKPSR